MDCFVNSFDGTKIFYNLLRGKKNHFLVFLHGVGANWTIWKKELAFFKKKGYSLIAIDLRGHGLSDKPEEEESYFFPNFAKDVKAVITKEKIKRFTLIGHSLGGSVAISYCGQFKSNQATSLVLVETSYRYPFEKGKDLNMNPFLSHLLRFIAKHEHIQNKHVPHMKDYDLTKHGSGGELDIILAALHVTPLKSIMNCLDEAQKYSFNHKQDTEKLLHSLKLPTLIIGGTDDHVVPIRFSDELHWLIKRSKLKIMQDAHHRVPIEKPHEFNTVVLRFLENKEFHKE